MTESADNEEKRKPNLKEVDEIFEEMELSFNNKENFKNSKKDLKIKIISFNKFLRYFATSKFFSFAIFL